jgi:hypothetical protein
MSVYIYDLMSKLRSDDKKRREVQEVVDRVKSLHQASREGKSSEDDIMRAMVPLVRLCGYNYGLMIPYLFPSYPRDKALSLQNRPFMFSMTTFSSNTTLTLRAGRQVGKCATGDTELQTELGVITLRDLFDLGKPIEPTQ